jgi:hypothetical protein
MLGSSEKPAQEQQLAELLHAAELRALLVSNSSFRQSTRPNGRAYPRLFLRRIRAALSIDFAPVSPLDHSQAVSECDDRIFGAPGPAGVEHVFRHPREKPSKLAWIRLFFEHIPKVRSEFTKLGVRLATKSTVFGFGRVAAGQRVQCGAHLTPTCRRRSIAQKFTGKQIK